MKIHKDLIQGSASWLAARAGIVTASECGTLVCRGKKRRPKGTPKPAIEDPEMWVPSEGKGVETYMALKLAEWWLGRPVDSGFKSSAMDRGTVLEDDALPKFELETGLALERVGFVTTDDGLMGCSPDSMIVESIVGLECKSPLAQTHVKYLLDGGLPDEYFPQVQTSMYVTGAKHWWFMSYCPGFPELIQMVLRDEEYLQAFAVALEGFNARMKAGKAKLKELNGGIEPVRVSITEEEADGVTTRTLDGIDTADLL